MIAVFENARAVVKAEKLCREAGIAVAVVPQPAHMTSECGMALRIEPGDREHFFELMKTNNIYVRTDQ